MDRPSVQLPLRGRGVAAVTGGRQKGTARAGHASRSSTPSPLLPLLSHLILLRAPAHDARRPGRQLLMPRRRQTERTGQTGNRCLGPLPRPLRPPPTDPRVNFMCPVICRHNHIRLRRPQSIRPLTRYYYRLSPWSSRCEMSRTASKQLIHTKLGKSLHG